MTFFKKAEKLHIDNLNKTALQFVPSSLEDSIFFSFGSIHSLLAFCHRKICNYFRKRAVFDCFLGFFKTSTSKKNRLEKNNPNFFSSRQINYQRYCNHNLPSIGQRNAVKSALEDFWKISGICPLSNPVLKLQLSWEKSWHVHYSYRNSNNRLWWSFGKSEWGW